MKRTFSTEIPSLPLAVSRVELRHLRHGGILLAGCAAARHVPAAALPRVISLLLCHGGRLRLCAGRLHAAWRHASGGQRLAARDLLCAGDVFLRGRCFRHVPHL